MNAAEEIAECLRKNCPASATLDHGTAKACGETFLDEDHSRDTKELSKVEVAFLASRW